MILIDNKDEGDLLGFRQNASENIPLITQVYHFPASRGLSR